MGRRFESCWARDNLLDRRARTLLWFDAGPGLAVGLLALALREVLAPLYGLSLTLVTVIACANLAYGAVSGTLALRASGARPPGPAAIATVATANALWTCACVVLLVTTRADATLFGQAHLALEGGYCALLAVLELRLARRLARSSPPRLAADEAVAPANLVRRP